MIDDPLFDSQLHTYPRLYVGEALVSAACVFLDAGQAHYLRNVLRRQEGAYVRVFNGCDGEWLACIDELGKKKGTLRLEGCLRAQPLAGQDVRLYFSPIRKQRMDMLIEKAVELGVSSLHPVLMNRSVVRKVNKERVRVQIIEACEQCERLDVPAFHDMCSFDEMLGGVDLPFYACVERCEQACLLSDFRDMRRAGFLIGPEGGFHEREVALLSGHNDITAVSLGASILRAETAAFACLSWALFVRRNGEISTW
ncbi:MAG: RsmE family RNA methyltransferase [Alphaproteobacteria bacterium]